MDTAQHKLDGWTDRRIVAEDPEALLRPEDFTARYVPAEAAGVADLLCLGDISLLAAQQSLFGPLAFGDVGVAGEPSRRAPLFIPAQKPSARDRDLGAVAGCMNDLALPMTGTG